MEIVAPATDIKHFTEQDGAAVAELRHEMPKLIEPGAMALPARISTP